MSKPYDAIIEQRAKDFAGALDGAARVTIHTPNALGEWNSENFSPEAVKQFIGGTAVSGSTT